MIDVNCPNCGSLWNKVIFRINLFIDASIYRELRCNRCGTTFSVITAIPLVKQKPEEQ